MGMESGSVLDFQISASSYLSDEFSPVNARLDSDTAWVAEESDDDQYIQVMISHNNPFGTIFLHNNHEDTLS